MASRNKSILDWNLKPDNSGDVYPAPHAIFATNDLWDHMILAFGDTATKVGCRGLFQVPADYTSSPIVKVAWSATVTSGGVRWEFAYRPVRGDDANGLDQSTPLETVAVTDNAPSVPNNLLVASLALTGSNLQPGDLIEFAIYRDGTHGGDTMAAVALVHAAAFEYQAN